MKLLIFEYVIGGGLARESLPESLAAEGWLMVKALLDDLSELPEVETRLLLDARLYEQIGAASDAVDVVTVDSADDLSAVIERSMVGVDAVWPIAPETGGNFSSLVARLEQYGKAILCSSAETIALTADKYRTVQRLAAHGIETVPTELLERVDFSKTGRRVIKPIDGAGCERTYIVDDWPESMHRWHPLQDYIVQPFIQGSPKSLSCLFRNGEAWLLSVNRQRIEISDQRFQLIACEVNVVEDRRILLDLVARVAQALPELWGYAGIDFIDSEQGIAILEINPRLTTSYVGIRQALGINVAGLVLALSKSDPVFASADNRSVLVPIKGGGIGTNS